VACLALLVALLLAAIGLALLLPVLLVLAVLLALLLHMSLVGHDQAVIVLGMLEVILGHDAVAGRVRVAGELEVLLVNVVGVAADLHVGAVRVDRAVNVEDLVLVLLAALVARAAATTTAAATAVVFPTAPAAAALVVVAGSLSHVHWEFRLTLSLKIKNLFAR
jgi:hypothetical protein